QYPSKIRAVHIEDDMEKIDNIFNMDTDENPLPDLTSRDTNNQHQSTPIINEHEQVNIDHPPTIINSFTQ
ncbi:hypothetical protein RhiirC2_801752, partial [Rhizophagus irregularis]